MTKLKVEDLLNPLDHSNYRNPKKQRLEGIFLVPKRNIPQKYFDQADAGDFTNIITDILSSDQFYIDTFCRYEGDTLLAYATSQLRIDVIEALLKKGANPYMLSERNDSSLCAYDYVKYGLFAAQPVDQEGGEKVIKQLRDLFKVTGDSPDLSS